VKDITGAKKGARTWGNDIRFGIGGQGGERSDRQVATALRGLSPSAIHESEKGEKANSLVGTSGTGRFGEDQKTVHLAREDWGKWENEKKKVAGAHARCEELLVGTARPTAAPTIG